MKKIISLSLVSIACAAGLGCSAIGKRLVEQPKVALDRVNVRDVGGSGATVVFGVRVDNPNPFALKVDALRYEVEIGGKPLSTGQLDQAAEVAGNGNTVVEIPIAVKYSDVFSSLTSFLSNGSSTYRIKGDATFGLFTIPFDQSGDLKLKK